MKNPNKNKSIKQKVHNKYCGDTKNGTGPKNPKVAARPVKCKIGSHCYKHTVPAEIKQYNGIITVHVLKQEEQKQRKTVKCSFKRGTGPR